MLKIYLADLVYDVVKFNYVVPLNVAYIAAYLQEKFPGQTDIRIFKYPKHLEQELKQSPPDILGLSNYSWNERLSRNFYQMAKELHPNIINVMGGPNIRIKENEIHNFLLKNHYVDYYMMYEAEETFGGFVEAVLGDRGKPENVPGCAWLHDGEFRYLPNDIKSKSRELDIPSPYLSGFLDEFIADPNIMPLLETNRGCPFGCTFCSWGIAALSKVRKRPIEVVYEEIDYVSNRSAGQVNWIFCDANFGILERDLDIAHRIRNVMDKKGYPISVTLWHSKNTSDRNIEIAKIVNDREGYIALQSTDEEVLKHTGRGSIKLDHLINQVRYYKEQNMDVSTDILIGLPGESAQSHTKTLETAFDLGFGNIRPYNIRMLPGSQYETPEDREQFGVQTKFRPIFGSYGIYDGKRVFEIEESVRATKDMSESELENFKLIHWMIYLCWNNGLFKPLLSYGMEHGINPVSVFHALTETKNPILSQLFASMKEMSLSEWFDSKDEMIQFYEHEENYNKLVTDFAKLSVLWIAQVFSRQDILNELIGESVSILQSKLHESGKDDAVKTLEELSKIVGNLICKDLLMDSYSQKEAFSGQSIKYALGKNGLMDDKQYQVEFYREKRQVDFCHYHLKPNGNPDMSFKNVARFLEMGGMKMLKNSIRVLQ